MKNAMLITGMLVLAACKNTTDPTLTETSCDAGRYDYIPIVQVVSCGTNCTTTTTTVMPVYTCTKSHVVTRSNPDYIPPRQCEYEAGMCR